MPLPLLPGGGDFTGAIVVAEGASAELVPGPRGAPAFTGPIRPAPVPAPPDLGGPWLPEEAPLGPNTVLLAGVPVSRSLTIAGYPRAMNPRCRPQLNDTGTGSIVLTNSDAAALVESGDDVRFKMGGRQVWFGIISDRTRHEVNQAEASGELTDVNLVGALAELGDVLVLPDFGSTDPTKLGQPLQDSRIFDWTTNSTAPRSAFDKSVSIHPLYAEPFGFQLPHTWPTPQPWWMWDRSPSNYSPAGDVYFRSAFGPTAKTRVQLWMTAYDHAEAWLDGVQVLTCPQPGVPQYVELDVGGHYHLVTIKATNDSMRAGVLFAVVEVTNGAYGRTLLTSGPISDGTTYTWQTSGYKAPIVFTPGEIITRLALEAQQRNTIMRRWMLNFGTFFDSAGRPWPATDAVAIPVGKTMLDVLRQLNEAHIDFACAPGSRTLHAWVKGSGTGVVVADPWAALATSRDVKVLS